MPTSQENPTERGGGGEKKKSDGGGGEGDRGEEKVDVCILRENMMQLFPQLF